MMVSEKFEAYYKTLSYDDKIEAMRVIHMLCEEHEKMMSRKQQQLITMGTLANKLLFAALTGGNHKEIEEQMKKLREEVEKTSKYMPIERYIELHFGL